jgi:hypothetical protein
MSTTISEMSYIKFTTLQNILKVFKSWQTINIDLPLLVIPMLFSGFGLCRIVVFTATLAFFFLRTIGKGNSPSHGHADQHGMDVAYNLYNTAFDYCSMT